MYRCYPLILRRPIPTLFCHFYIISRRHVTQTEFLKAQPCRYFIIAWKTSQTLPLHIACAQQIHKDEPPVRTLYRGNNSRIDGGCRFFIWNKALIPVIRYRVDKLNTVSILPYFMLTGSLSLYSMIVKLKFGVSPLSHVFPNQIICSWRFNAPGVSARGRLIVLDVNTFCLLNLRRGQTLCAIWGTDKIWVWRSPSFCISAGARAVVNSENRQMFRRSLKELVAEYFRPFHRDWMNLSQARREKICPTASTFIRKFITKPISQLLFLHRVTMNI